MVQIGAESHPAHTPKIHGASERGQLSKNERESLVSADLQLVHKSARVATRTTANTRRGGQRERVSGRTRERRSAAQPASDKRRRRQHAGDNDDDDERRFGTRLAGVAGFERARRDARATAQFGAQRRVRSGADVTLARQHANAARKRRRRCARARPRREHAGDKRERHLGFAIERDAQRHSRQVRRADERRFA